MVNYLLKICFIILALGVIAITGKISLAKEGLGVPTSDYAATRVPHTPSADPPPLRLGWLRACSLVSCYISHTILDFSYPDILDKLHDTL